ncbi:gliding motility protein GldL, partial [Odoribacter sp. OttesenSCG-928-A06]|nr:gliding motility protein GldL [Odoribacter sp. OttesenSCG-928-A06]
MAKIFQSKAYQTIMGYVYGWGAAAVIIGALFKIMHFPGAGAILTVGMLVEAVIFFLSAFEPPMEHYDWTRVFPELSHSAHPLDAATPARGPRAVEQNVQHVQSSTAAPVVATANLNIGLDPSDIEQLKEGIHKIVKSADSFAEATTYVPEFSKKINEVTTSFEKLGNHLGTSAEGFESLNKIVGEQANQMKSQGENY